MFVMQLPLLSDLPARPENGSLALGAQLAEHGPEVRYREVACRSVLGRSPAAARLGMPFTWTINPYRGCEIGCAYCYARYTHGYLGLQDPHAFEREIFVKLGAERGIARSLRPEHFSGAEIAIGTATDPYQPAERRYRITRRILEKLAAFSGLSVTLTTKSPLILDDLELLARLGRRSRLTVHVSLISLDPEVVRRLEPKGATPDKRLEAVARLAQAGVRVGLFLMPVLPGINDDAARLARLDAVARSAGAAFVCRQPVSVREASWPALSEALQRHYPHLLARYRREACRP